MSAWPRQPARGWLLFASGCVSWIDANTPPDARIAAYNAGIEAYLSDRTVVKPGWSREPRRL